MGEGGVTDRCDTCGRDPELGLCTCEPAENSQPATPLEVELALEDARAHLARAKTKAGK